MSVERRRLLLVVRSALVVLGLAALASPAWVIKNRRQSVVFVVDHTESLGRSGLETAYEAVKEARAALPGGTKVGVVAAGKEPRLLAGPGERIELNLENGELLLDEIGSQSHLAAAVDLARGVFPAGAAKHVIYVGDGLETRGDLRLASREAAVEGLRIHAIPVGGEKRPDVRVTSLIASDSRLNEGATLALTARVESTIEGEGVLRLFENGLEVERVDLTLGVGEEAEYRFERIPDRRNIYQYRAVLEGFEGDAIPENNASLSIVDVRGKPLWLYIEGEESEARYLMDAMDREGIRLDLRNAETMPRSLRELNAYDGVILSDIAAHLVGEDTMAALRDYVGELGGGFCMIGGMNSFGVGGYYRTPIEDLLPVKLKAPDTEVQHSSALALVLDRSGSMSGQKIELCKSAAIATAEILTKRDFIHVVAFDSSAHVVVPMTRVNSPAAIAAQISTLTSGGGTNIYPGMANARNALSGVNARIKHMIVLTDGHTSGGGYEALAATCRAEGITISTVAVGNGAQVGLLQSIAAAGGGEAYLTMDPQAITRIFTQDTMRHTGRMIREEAFQPTMVERHPMLKNWTEIDSPPLLGYVKTNRKATAQIPLVTDLGDPLLAHWRFGLGKVTAFTSDCKSRWASLWIGQWSGYSQMWAQILRETARETQGHNIDLNFEPEGEEIGMAVDLLEDAGTRKNGAEVEGDVYFMPAQALGSTMRLIDRVKLGQDGPGSYRGSFRPEKPGVYLVRARSGAQMVSAGYVFNPSSEAATGQVDEELLKEVTEVSGGMMLAADLGKIALQGEGVARHVELWPWILYLMLALFLADVAIRRWENVRGMMEYFGELTSARR